MLIFDVLSGQRRVGTQEKRVVGQGKLGKSRGNDLDFNLNCTRMADFDRYFSDLRRKLLDL